MKGTLGHKVLKKTLLGLIITLAVVIVLPFTLYIPPVQSLVKYIAAREASKATGWNITIGGFYLKFPLRLQIEDLLVLTTPKDTMIASHNFEADVAFRPLFDKKIEIRTASLNDGMYSMYSKDSSMYLHAKLAKCDIKAASIDLKNNLILLDNGDLNGGDVRLVFDKSKEKPEPEDTTKSMPWRIIAKKITINNVHYSMNMLPVIDKINATVEHGLMKNGLVDTKKCIVSVDYIGIDGVNAVYLTPTAQYLATHPYTEPVDTVATPGPDWTITGKVVSLKRANGIYAVSGAKPVSGLDLNYIQGTNLAFEVRNFYNKGMVIKVPIQSLSGWERCGLQLVDGSGTFEMDSTYMAAHNFKINTIGSNIALNAKVESGVFENNRNSLFNLKTDASINPAEIGLLYPFTKKYIKLLPSSGNMAMQMNLDGSLNRLNINKVSIKAPNMLTAQLNGRINNILSTRHRNGNIKIEGKSYSLNSFKSLFLASNNRNEINIPPMTLNGNVHFSGPAYNGKIAMTAPSGEVKLDGGVNMSNEKFDAVLNLNSFPIRAFLPKSNCGNLTAKLTATGHGFNPLRKRELLNANFALTSFQFNNKDYNDINAVAHIENGELNMTIDSKSKALGLYSELKSSLLNDYYDYTMRTQFFDVDLQEMGYFDVPFTLNGNVSSSGTVDMKHKIYDCVGMVDNFSMIYNQLDLKSDLALGFLYSNPDSLRVGLQERDFNTDLYVHCSLDAFINKLDKLSNIVSDQIEARVLNFGEVNAVLPKFELFSKMGRDNIVSDYLKQNKCGLKSFNLSMNKDSILRLDSKLLSLKLGSITLDTITLNAHQEDKDLLYVAHVGNRNGNLDQFASSYLRGKIGDNTLTTLFTQTNNKGVVGFNIGINGAFANNEFKMNFFPDTPTIGFKPWLLNENNFVEYNPTKKHFDANLKLSNQSGYISLFTSHKSDSAQEDIKLDIKGINLGEWLNLSPYSPQINGIFNADATLKKGGSTYSGDGNFSIADLLYNRSRVGNLGFDLNMDVNPLTGQNEAQAVLMVDGRKALKVHGVLSDSINKSPNFGLTLDRLPLTIANPFIPNRMIVLGGYLNGEMSMKGKTSAPILNGYLECDSTFLNIPIFGSKLRMDSNPIKVEENNILFDNFGIRGGNGNPLLINGTVNIVDFAKPSMNLAMNGDNIQIIDSKYHSNSQMFGNGFVNINAKARGKLSMLNVNADLEVLPETNATYVMQSDVGAISSQQQLEGLVKFVSFNDTIAKDTIPIEDSFAMNLNAKVNVAQGSILNVNLSPNGKNKVQIEGNGNLIYNLNYLGDSRLTGRYTINSGFVRYYPPLISEKYFTFTPGSYVAWTGDMMNPTLSLSANATQASTILTDGTNPVRVNFLITAAVTNTVNNMNVTFDLDAPNNSVIGSELQSMTPTQRSAQAINLMLYNSYTGDNSATASAPNTNMLYSVLSSQLNNLASKVVKNVDISFGINEYNRGSSGGAGTGMNYSYQISKSLFHDRFRMTVGGNYDTSLTNDNDIAQNLFSDVSFEYNITPSGSMSIKVYNKLTDNNIYQTQVNETGVAFILRRRLLTLKDLFNFKFLNKFQKSKAAPVLLKREEVNESK